MGASPPSETQSTDQIVEFTELNRPRGIDSHIAEPVASEKYLDSSAEMHPENAFQLESTKSSST